MDTPSLISILQSNVSVLALGVGIGVAYAILYYYYTRMIKGEESAPLAINPLKEIFFTIVVIAAIIALDHAFASFLSALLGVEMAPGQHVRLSEAIAERQFSEIKSVLYWSYLGEFVFNFFAAISYGHKFDLKPGFISQPLGLGAVGKGMSKLLKALLDKLSHVPGAKSLGKAVSSALDLGEMSITLQPFSGVLVLWDILEKISMFLFVMTLGYFLYYTIITFIIPLSAVFLPLGLGLMFVPVLRKTGASIVALVLTMYFVFPLLTIYLDGVFRAIQWYDANKLFGFLSPTILGMLTSDPGDTADWANVESSSFLSRELGYNYVKLEMHEVSLDFNTSASEIITRYIQYEQTCIDLSECKNIYNQQIENETATKGAYQNLRPPNVIAPWISFLTKTGEQMAAIWMLSKVGSVIDSGLTSVEAYSTLGGPIGWAIGVVSWLIRSVMNLLVALYMLAMVVPIPDDSPLKSVMPVFLPFLFYKSTMIFILYVAQYMLLFATMLFFQISMVISGYRSISSIIGGELSLPGLDKVI